jgi:hypothetical protein
MGGSAPVGQLLTPNPNVSAPAGMGGDKWGANGGDITPVGVGKPVAATLCNGETATNYIPPPLIPLPASSVLARESNGSMSNQKLDSTIAGGGTSAG